MIVNIKNHSNKFEHTTHTTRLYNEIRSNEVLSKEEEVAIFKLIKHGTEKEKKKAIDRITNANMKFVVSIARAYSTNANLEELISEGLIGLMEAINKYDISIALEKDVKFSTFAVEYIRRSINLYRINYGAMVKQTNRAKTIHYLSKAKSSFMQKFERQPTSDELVEWLNENYLDAEHQLDNPRDVEEIRYPSIDEPLEMGDDEDTGNAGFMMSYNSETKQSNSFETVEDKEYINGLINKVLSDVNKRDRDIIKMCFGIGYQYPISVFDIAEKMSLTPERVRQIRADVIKKLKASYNGKALGLI